MHCLTVTGKSNRILENLEHNRLIGNDSSNVQARACTHRVDFPNIPDAAPEKYKIFRRAKGMEMGGWNNGTTFWLSCETFFGCWFGI
jgi:hypothetical protein